MTSAADLFSVEISLVVTASQCPSEEDEQILRDTVIAQSQCDGASLHDVTLTCDSTVSQSNFFTFAILYLIILQEMMNVQNGQIIFMVHCIEIVKLMFQLELF